MCGCLSRKNRSSARVDYEAQRDFLMMNDWEEKLIIVMLCLAIVAGQTEVLNHSGVEQWQLARLITSRSPVRVRSPQLGASGIC